MKQLILLTSLLFILTSCFSVKKYNRQISKLHTPQELKEDVDYAYKKLKRLQPNLYLYISQNDLESKFDSLKNTLNKPMSSRDFYLQLAPVIMSIRQGHTSISPPFKEQTKNELKQKGERRNPFRKFRFRKLQDKVILTRNFGKDSTIQEGSELLKIDNIEVSTLLESFKNLITGDGYNTTLVPEISRRYIGSLYLRTHGYKDSLMLTLRKNNLNYDGFVYAYPKKSKVKVTKPKKEKLSKEAKKIAKKEKKARKKWNRKYGYNKNTKEKTRDLSFIKTDSTPTIAYLKIRRFMVGSYHDFYEETFQKIDSAKTKYLVIDLRYNGGGRLSEIGTLYSYLIDKEEEFIMNAKMTHNSSWMYPLYHNKSALKTSIFSILYPVARVIQAIKVEKIDDVSYFKFKSNRLREPSENYNYKGEIYVLINGASFSASSIISNNLKASKRAYFVGDETGGAYNSTVAGRMAEVELPNSKATLTIGLMNLETYNKTIPDGYGVTPDKYIKVTTLKKDEQLDWIIGDISKKEDH